MYRVSPGIGNRLAILLALVLFGTAGRLTGQQSVGESLHVHSVVPKRIQPGSPAHLHLEGTFPAPNRTFLTRLLVRAETPRYGCELGWSEEAVRTLVEDAGLPWLVEADLFSGGEMDLRRQCGTIDGMWEDRIEVTLRHPALLLPGSLVLEVALAAASQAGAASRETRGSQRIELEVGGRLRVAGHLPDRPVAEPGRDLLIALVIEGGPPEAVELLTRGEWRPVIHRSDPRTARLTLTPQQYEAPGELVLRLRKGSEVARTRVTVCMRETLMETRCPPPSPM